MIEARDVTVSRRLAGVTLSLSPGEVVGIIGPSGAGKSTLLAALAGDLPPTSGEILLDGQALGTFSPDALARRRAVLPQSSPLSFGFRVHELVALGRAPWGDEGTPSVRRALADVGLAGLAARSYLTLSGGEKQRAHLARVLAQLDGAERPTLLADEPTAHLDVGHTRTVLALLRAVAHRGVAVLVVLHDLQAALAFTDRLLLLAEGRPVAFGPPAEVLDSASDTFGCPVAVRELEGRAVVLTG
jgi:iron complex transport system ATP-binding protein